MGKFIDLENNVFSHFGSAAWQAEVIPSYPANVYPEGITGSYIKHSIVANGDHANANSVSGLLMVEIYTAAGIGPTSTSEIADTLDKHFQRKTYGLTQFFLSNLGQADKDRDNPSLSRAIYQIPFTYFGVTT